jgi:cytochrome c peroxidase
MTYAHPTVLTVLLAALLLPAGALAAGPLADAPVEPGCGLLADGGGSGSDDSKSCLKCHTAAAHGAHPVEVDYAQARSRRGFGRTSFRPLAEVSARGVRLVEGKVTCVTCHSGSSRLPAHLASPAGTDNDLGQPSPRYRAAMASAASGRRPRQDPTALCISCHLMGESPSLLAGSR